MDVKKRFVFVLVAAALALSGCAATQGVGGPGDAVLAEEQEVAEPAKKSGDSEIAKGVLDQPVPMVSGPKRTVAVGKFDANGAFRQKYGDWDIGGGLSAMLTTALIESNRFIVLERANVGQVLSEQELKGHKLVVKQSGPELGKLIGAQLLVYGSVTEFDESESGGGFSVGFAGGGIGSLIGGALSPQYASGTVAMDIRVVDTTTGEVVETHRVEESVSSTAFDVSFTVEEISLGTNAFFKTPLGDATRKAINKVVQLIARDAQKTSWSGRVVDIDGRDVYINAGSRSGLKVGDKFMIRRVVKKFTDPETGKVLGTKKKELGVVNLTRVEEGLATGTYLPVSVELPKRGDIVLALK